MKDLSMEDQAFPKGFCNCFKVDLYARTEKRYSWLGLLGRKIFNPGYSCVVNYRLAMYFKRSSIPLTTWFGKLILAKLSRSPGVEIRTSKEIGPGVMICHPHDIVIGEGAVIGKNVTIYNGVSLGARIPIEMDDNKQVDTRYPVIEDGVTLFSGAKVIGPVTIGQGSVVGANSVVNRSFGADSTIAGAPAREIKKKE